MIDIFASPSLRELFVDAHGLLKRAARVARALDRPKRNFMFAARVLGIAATLNVAEVAHATEAPAQLALAWPTSELALTAKEVLQESLQKMRGLKANWNGRGAPAPAQQAIAAAQYVLGQLPDVQMNASAGVDPDGHVFLRLKRGSRVAYLTVEPKAMHLLYMEPGQDNVYIDDEQFKGKIIPASIKKVLDERLKA